MDNYFLFEFGVTVSKFIHVLARFRTTIPAVTKKIGVFVKAHKLPAAIIVAAVIVSASTIGVAAITNNQKPVAMAPVIEKRHAPKQANIEEVKSASTDTPTASDNNIATASTSNTTANQTKPVDKTASPKPASTTTPSSSAAPSNPSPTTTTPPSSAAPSFRIDIRENQVSTYTYMDWHILTVPFSIIKDNGFVAKTYEQPFCVLVTVPTVDHGVFCEIHQKEADNPGAVVSYKDSSSKGHYTIQARYSINGVVRTDSFSFDL